MSVVSCFYERTPLEVVEENERHYKVFLKVVGFGSVFKGDGACLQEAGNC